MAANRVLSQATELRSGLASLRFVALCMMALTLGSCSYGYDLLAVAINGRVAFIVDPLSEFQADCVDGISVDADKGEPKATPAKGDDRLMVINGGSYWEESFDSTTCANKFPIFYGAPLSGTPFIYDDGKPARVAAKPLHVGAIYQVSTTSSGSGSGMGWFRITPDLRIENYRDDPTPPTSNEDGYDVTDYANYVSQAENRVYLP